MSSAACQRDSHRLGAECRECSGRDLHEKPGRGVGSSGYLLLQEWPGKQRRREPVLCPSGFVQDQPRQQGTCVDLSVCRCLLARLHHHQQHNGMQLNSFARRRLGPSVKPVGNHDYQADRWKRVEWCSWRDQCSLFCLNPAPSIPSSAQT